jgi:Cell division protein CrgA
VPESKGRNKPAYTPPRTAPKDTTPNPRWFVPLMLGLMVVGLLWVVTYYISGVHQYPVPALGRWNLGVGFGLMLSGFLMTTRWR